MILSSLVLAAALAAPGDMPDFNADAWWNSVPLTVEQLRGRTVFVEVFRTW